MCSVRSLIIAFFIISTCCLTAETWQKEIRKGTKRHRGHTKTQMNLQCHVCAITSVPEIELASHEHHNALLETFRCTPPNPSGQTFGAGQPCYVSHLAGNYWTLTPSCLAGCGLLVPIQTHIHLVPEELFLGHTIHMYITVLSTQMHQTGACEGTHITMKM